MKKFIDKKVMDWKFKKAGDGHSLSEESGPSRQQPPSKPGIHAIVQLNIGLYYITLLSVAVFI